MFKNFIVLLYVLFFWAGFTTSAYCQQLKWERSYGGTENDFGYGMIKSNSGAELIIIGATRSDDIEMQHTPFVPGKFDCFLFKVDTVNGNIIDSVFFGGTDDDFFSDIVPAFDGGYLVVGTTNSNDGDVSGNHGAADVWVMHLSENGTLLWKKCFGGSARDENPVICRTSDSSYVISAWTTSDDGDITFNHGVPGSYDIWNFKIDTLGNLLWSQTYGGSYDEYPAKIIETSDHGLIVVGDTYSNDQQVSNFHGGSDVYLFKTDSFGNFLWSNCFGGSSIDGGESIAVLNGKYYVLGINISNDGDVSNNHLTNTFPQVPSGDCWLICTDLAGSLQWEKSYGGSGDEIGKDFNIFNNEIYILTRASSNDGDLSFNHGADDYWVFQLDTIGNILYEKTFGGQTIDRATSLIVDSSNIYCIGYSESSNGDITNNHGGLDAWLIDIDNLNLLSDITQRNLKSDFFIVNPVLNGHLKYFYNINVPLEINVKNISGIDFGKFFGNDGNLDLTNLTEGIYFLQVVLKTTNEIFYEKIVIHHL